ncbi:acyl carrier protein [Streptomyces sp. DH12]|uniref:acyl carrier protein n=1 Tax=Streptomyces sp. DH12 TaxID=2857010 RepID=UPI001E3AB896|nr:acyl carrier protein [Streptomyces sp. DH12]
MTDDLTRLLVDDLSLPADRLTDDASPDHAGLDSLAVVELSVLLADRYGIDIPYRDIERAGTLGDLDRLITAKRSER